MYYERNFFLLVVYLILGLDTLQTYIKVVLIARYLQS